MLAAVLILAITNAYSYVKGGRSADTRWTAKIQTERAEAEAAARATEHRHQEQANAIAKRHATEVSKIRGALDIALDSLRDRPERPAGLPDAGRPDCAGGTGAELSGADARFLAGEAARADEVRAGLQACYEHIDAMIE